MFTILYYTIHCIPTSLLLFGPFLFFHQFAITVQALDPNSSNWFLPCIFLRFLQMKSWYLHDIQRQESSILSSTGPPLSDFCTRISYLCKLITSNISNVLLVPWRMHWVVKCFVADPQLPRISFCSARVAFSCLLGHSLLSCPPISASPPSCRPTIHSYCPEAALEATQVLLQKLTRKYFQEYSEEKKNIYCHFCLLPDWIIGIPSEALPKLGWTSHHHIRLCFARTVSNRVNVIQNRVASPIVKLSVLHDLFLIVWISAERELCLIHWLQFMLQWLQRMMMHIWKKWFILLRTRVFKNIFLNFLDFKVSTFFPTTWWGCIVLHFVGGRVETQHCRQNCSRDSGDMGEIAR